MKVRVLLYLARLCGKLIGILKRNQIRLLTRATWFGWMPNEEEAQRLRVGQTQLFNFNQAKLQAKKLKMQL